MQPGCSSTDFGPKVSQAEVPCGTEEAVYRFNINPLVWWVWFGGVVLMLGGLITLWPGGGPVARPRRAQAGYEVTLVGASGSAQ